MIRQAVPGDETAIEAFLARYPASSMFLRRNLVRHGLGQDDSPHATTYHLYPATGPLRAVIGRTAAGMVLCQFGDSAEALPHLIRGLDGQTIDGMSGEAGQTEAIVAALGLQSSFRRNAVEPLLHLNLAGLQEANDLIRPPVLEDEDMLTDWYSHYMVETGLGMQSPLLPREARARAISAIAGGSLRLLLREGQAVAMAAINARAAKMVQVAAVFVPQPMRNRGFARAVTRALLIEAREQGATEAVLVANNPAAARAYRGIGFVEVGAYRMALLAAPITIGVLP